MPIDPDIDLEEEFMKVPGGEKELARLIREERDLPYTLKVEKVEGNVIITRNSWQSHITYIFKDGTFYLRSELENKENPEEI